MLWYLLAVALALAALAVLVVLVLGLWRQVRALLHATTAAGETVATATDALAAAQDGGPLAGQDPARPPGR